MTLGPTLDGNRHCASTLDDVGRCARLRRSAGCAETSYPFYNSITVEASILRPRSRGNVTLRSADPFADPRIHPNFLGEQQDLDTLVEANRLILALPRTRTLTAQVGRVIRLTLSNRSLIRVQSYSKPTKLKKK